MGVFASQEVIDRAHETWRRSSVGNYFFERIPTHLWEDVLNEITPAIKDLFPTNAFTLDDCKHWHDEREIRNREFRRRRDNNTFFVDFQSVETAQDFAQAVATQAFNIGQEIHYQSNYGGRINDCISAARGLGAFASALSVGRNPILALVEGIATGISHSLGPRVAGAMDPNALAHAPDWYFHEPAGEDQHEHQDEA